jgi:hypothetical protein
MSVEGASPFAVLRGKNAALKNKINFTGGVRCPFPGIFL